MMLLLIKENGFRCVVRARFVPSLLVLSLFSLSLSIFSLAKKVFFVKFVVLLPRAPLL